MPGEAVCQGVSSTADGVSNTAEGVSNTADGVSNTADGVSNTADRVSNTADGVSKLRFARIWLMTWLGRCRRRGHPASACLAFAGGLAKLFAPARTATRVFAPPVTKSMVFRPQIRLDRPPKKMRLSIYLTYLYRLSIYSTYLHLLSIYSTYLAFAGGLVKLFAPLSFASRAFAPPVTTSFSDLRSI